MPGPRRLCRLALLIMLGLAIVSAAPAEQPGPVRLSPDDDRDAIAAKAASVRPHPRQVAWQELEYAMFVHFGMNTFTNKQWGDGTEDPAWFNPSELDPGQWAKTAKDAGMKMLVLTAKHHDGFCLWPSRLTEHSVKNSPWKDGAGDVVAETAAACRAQGIKFGVYLSPWDRHEPSYGTADYNDYFMGQLRELLTGYGEIADVWLDGAGMGEAHRRMLELYDWDAYFRLIRELAPMATISISGPDVRWCGNEAGKGRKDEWSVVPLTEGLKLDWSGKDLGSMKVLGQAAKLTAELRWYPAQVDVSIRPSWFYEPREDLLVKRLDRLVDIYLDSVGGNAMLLLNVPPDQRGLLHENDVSRLLELGAYLDRLFAQDLALGAQVGADAQATGGGHPPAVIADGDDDTFWTTDDGTEAATLELELPAAATFDLVLLAEKIEEGQRIERFQLEVQVKGKWKKIASGGTVGYKRFLRFKPVTAQKLRLHVQASRVRPTLRAFSLYKTPALK